MVGKIESYLSAPRWAGACKFLHDLAWACSLELSITHHDKGFIRETIYYTVRGEEDRLKLFKKQFNETMEEMDGEAE